MAREVFAKTVELPSRFDKNEMALMTWPEYEKFQNAEDKYHDSNSYNVNLANLNYDSDLTELSHWSVRGDLYSLWKSPQGLLLKVDGKDVAVIHNGIVYTEKFLKKYLPVYPQNSGKLLWSDPVSDGFSVDDIRIVKYVSEYVSLISNVAKKNRQRYRVLHQRFKAGDEYLEIRSGKTLSKNKGQTLGVLNSEGFLVARASDEWGATLIQVVAEYQRKGVGSFLTEFWKKWNPDFKSGGYTPAGREQAFRVWNNRVKEFLSRGWYSALVSEGKMSTARVKEIVSDLSDKSMASRIPLESTPEVKRQILYYIEYPSFVIYDTRYFIDQDDKYIHAHGLFRSSTPGDFLYKIEYDRPYAEAATEVALQMARDEGHSIYVGEGYGDTLEYDLVPEASREGDYVSLDEDVLNLATLRRREESYRRPRDRYGESLTLLLEGADSKW